MTKPFSKFVQDEKDAKNNLMIVDGLNLAFRWKHKGQTQFIDDYITTVESLSRSYSCKRIVIAIDDGKSSYRNNIYPEYKNNREELRANQTEAEKQSFAEFFEEFTNLTDVLKANKSLLTVKERGVEADDVAAYISKNKNKYNVEKIWLISSDKDWDLLISEDISRFSYVTRKETRTDNFTEIHKGVPLEHFLSVKCLHGDSGDNIPGITQIGPARALELINKYGSAMDLYDACPLQGSGKIIQYINSEAEKILLNYELMDLLSFCEDAIGQAAIEKIDGSMMELMNAAV